MWERTVVVLIVNAFSDFQQEMVEYGVRIRFYNSNVQAKIVDVDTGRLIGTETKTELGRARTSLEKAGERIAPILMEKTVKAWRQRGYGSENEVEIVIDNVTFSDLMKLKKEIEKTRGVTSVSSPTLTKRVGNMRVRGTIQASNMAVKLSELKGFNLEVTSMTQNRIDIEFSN